MKLSQFQDILPKGPSNWAFEEYAKRIITDKGWNYLKMLLPGHQWNVLS